MAWSREEPSLPVRTSPRGSRPGRTRPTRVGRGGPGVTGAGSVDPNQEVRCPAGAGAGARTRDRGFEAANTPPGLPRADPGARVVRSGRPAKLIRGLNELG